MKVTVDQDLCRGHARCVAYAPGMFVMRDGLNATPPFDVPPGREEEARRAALSCPEKAITIDGG